MRLPEAFDGFTIAQLSDFHYEDHFSVVPIRKAVEVVNELHPDLIVLTGDFVTVPFFSHARGLYPQSARNAETCADTLHNLRAAGEPFAVLGNHDAASNPVRITGALEDRGIPVLSNRSVPIGRGASRFWLAEIDDAPSMTGDITPSARGRCYHCRMFNFGKPKTASDWIVHMAGAIVAIFLVWWMLRMFVL